MDRIKPITAVLAVLTLAVGGGAGAQDRHDLAGFYYITPGGIGAGYADYFALFEDGTWEFGDQYICSDDGALNEETVPHRAGHWRSDGAGLVLTEMERTVITGGACACDPIACVLVGGQENTVQPDWRIIVDPAAECESIHDPMESLGVDLPCLTIEGIGYFRLGRAEGMLE